VETRTVEQKRVILNKLVNSGINISPTMLKNILNINNPLKNLNLLIKEISFIPTFKSHLTETVIKDISDEKLQRVLNRNLSKTNPHKKKPTPSPNIPIFKKKQLRAPSLIKIFHQNFHHLLKTLKQNTKVNKLPLQIFYLSKLLK